MEDFDKRKRAALQALVNACEHDKSPKGSVDEPIQGLVDLINAHNDYSTTSSCSGRISLFHTAGSDSALKGTGKWLLALHRTLVDADELKQTLHQGLLSNSKEAPSMTLFKHEPFVLHVMCRTLEHAQAFLKIAMDAGFRESGLSVGSKKIMVGVRTTANVLECPVALDGKILCSEEYLDFLATEANRRFVENHRKTKHFEKLVRDAFEASGSIAPASSMFLTETSSFDISNARWNLLPKQVQIKRWGHTATEIGGGRILIFGGWGEIASNAESSNGSEKPQQHTHLAHSLVWDSPSDKIRPVSASKTEPLGRVYHTAVRLSDDWTIVFGGRRSPQSALNDFWAFHGDDEQWVLVHPDKHTVKEVPHARWRHAAVATEPKQPEMYIYGGRSLDTVFDDLWRISFVVHSSPTLASVPEIVKCERIVTKGSSPGPRFAHAMIYSPASRSILLHGGLGDVCSSDGPAAISVLDLATLTWSEVNVAGLNWRFSHCWTYLGGEGESLILGGLGKDYNRDDLQVTRGVKIRLDDPKQSQMVRLGVTGEDNRLETLLSVQCAVLVPSSSEEKGGSLCVLGGGATCFAFGSVFGSSAQLSNKGSDRTLLDSSDAEQAWEFVTVKTSAVRVKETLISMHAMDKSRKAIVDGDRIRFPILSSSQSKVEFQLQRSLQLGEVVSVKHTASSSSTSSPTKPIRSLEQRKEEVLSRIFGEASSRCKLEKVDNVVLIHAKGVSLSQVSAGDWQELLSLYPGTERVVWGAEVDEGPMRKSRNRLVYVMQEARASGPLPRHEECWVNVHENGITFSYDMLRCMYSKGNVAEKLRFGKLVQPGEVVLDLFAGIGYFTLPALKITDNARIVHACEWNPDALGALRRNLKLNHVAGGRCVLHPGDCRRVKLPEDERAHRVSLGLIPSSEVAWPTAVASLSDRGGWLHVHGNASETDVEAFGKRTAETIQHLCRRMRGGEWVAVCVHVQKVKSYAPRVLHLVADIKCGPKSDELLSPDFVTSVPPDQRKPFSKRAALPGQTSRKRSVLKSGISQHLAEEMIRITDELLCVSSVSDLHLEDAKVLAADGQLRMKRVSEQLKDMHSVE